MLWTLEGGSLVAAVVVFSFFRTVLFFETLDAPAERGVYGFFCLEFIVGMSDRLQELGFLSLELSDLRLEIFFLLGQQLHLLRGVSPFFIFDTVLQGLHFLILSFLLCLELSDRFREMSFFAVQVLDA